jgi:hypothetical protein
MALALKMNPVLIHDILIFKNNKVSLLGALTMNGYSESSAS